MEPEYIKHLAYLVEGIYMMLSDVITMNQLYFAKDCLREFYRKFADLYGE